MNALRHVLSYGFLAKLNFADCFLGGGYCNTPLVFKYFYDSTKYVQYTILNIVMINT